MTESLSLHLARFAESVGGESLPGVVRASVRRRMLDTLGVALAAVPLETSRAVIDRAAEQGGAPQATAIGLPIRVPAASAAFVNGVLAHSLDYDDTHLPSILHPSAPVIPAVLASAELTGATGAETLAAIAAGLEICVRLGMAAYDAERKDSLFFERGQHATSICGAIAGAAASAKLLGLDAGGIADAIGIAVSMASGVIEGNRTGGTVKRLHCGIAAAGAVTAADLARRGLTAPATALEGRFGFFAAFLDGRFDETPLRRGLGAEWEVPDIFFKPYPCNHFTHAGVDAAVALRAGGLDPDDVEVLHLGVATATVRTIGEPIDAKRAPETGYQAQFSGPYTVAAALLGGSGLGLGLDDFTDELAREPRRRALAARVTVAGDPDCDAIYPAQFPAVLRARTTSGHEFVRRVTANRGGPGRPLSDEELITKFRDNALRAIDEDAADRIEESALHLDEVPSAGELLGPAAGAK
jgi:2-methylcitrate dehydratase PrpD